MAKPGSDTIFCVLICVMVFLPLLPCDRKGKDLIMEVNDIKVLKKLLRTKTNVLITYAKSGKDLSKLRPTLNSVAEEVKGRGSVVVIDCSSAKKMCKKMKAAPSPISLKHYKDGKYHKDYDRQMTIKSMTNFLNDPSGEMPWEEDLLAVDVVHVENPQGLKKLFKKERLPILIMFYAPWCGYCKRMKPDFAMAASEMKGQAVLVGMDVDKPENSVVRESFNITGFPTILYIKSGKIKYKYGGENTKDGIVSWLKNPQPPKEPEKETEWSDEETDVAHLKEDTFNVFVKEHKSVLVMFYAPWCGHCKTMKPEYTEAAAELKNLGIDGALAAVDATKESKLGEKFGVKGFPSVKYFKDGELAFDFNERTKDKIIAFMMDPKEPPPPPPPEAEWADMRSEVQHLTDDTFKSTIKRKKHTLVMFYAPWCGHCKKAKPEFTEAAETFKDNMKVLFAAVDCTKHQSACSMYDVSGYPTIKYFTYGKDVKKYSGGRTKDDFIAFMTDPENPQPPKPKPSKSPTEQWAGLTGSDNLHHLSSASFSDFINKHRSVLVLFYAPWCGHCKAMKPAYAEAAQHLLKNNIDGVLATVDATLEADLTTQHKVQGYPTLKYFKDGVISEEYPGGRSKDDIIKYMQSKTEPLKTEEKKEKQKIDKNEKDAKDTRKDDEKRHDKKEDKKDSKKDSKRDSKKKDSKKKKEEL